MMTVATDRGLAMRRIGVAATVWAIVVAVSFANPGSGTSAEVFATALTLDFTILAPLIAYLIWMREKRAPLITLAPLFIVGCLLAMIFLPKDQQGALNQVRLLAIPLEIAVVTAIGLVAYRALRASRAAEGVDAVDRIRDAAQRIAHSRLAADILATEICMFRFALGGRIAKPAVRGPLSQDIGLTGPIVAALVAIVAIETVAVHLLLARWSHIAAWIATALSVYAIFWLLGDYRSLRARTSQVSDGVLRFRLGLRQEATIPLTQIESVESCRVFEKAPGSVKATAMQEPNLVIRLREPVEVVGMYGVRKRASAIAVRAANPSAMRASLLPNAP